MVYLITMNTTLITGNTYPVKEQLKALGAKWNKAQCGWNVPSEHAEQAMIIVESAGPKKEYIPRQKYRKSYGSSRYRSNIYNINGTEYYRNKAGRCIDAPCCGCCTI